VAVGRHANEDMFNNVVLTYNGFADFGADSIERFSKPDCVLFCH
jgi:hypothetical protein